MSNQDIWRILEIEETKDENKIKAAYRKKVVTVNPEDDAEGFKLLREAFDEAIRLSKEVDAASDEMEADLTDLERHIKRAEQIYNNVETRQNVEMWQEWLQHPLCQDLDTVNETREAFLAFTLEHFYMSHEVYAVINKEFQIVEEQEALKELFPPNFISYLAFHIENDDFFEYDELMTRSKKDAVFAANQCEDVAFSELMPCDYVPEDQYVCEQDGYISQVVNFTLLMERLLGTAKDEPGFGDFVKEVAGRFNWMEQQDLWHPYEYVEKMRYLYYIKDDETLAASMAEQILTKDIFPKFSCYGVTSATEIIIDRKVRHPELEIDFDFIKAKVQAVLDERPKFTGARLNMARLRMLMHECEDAKELVMDVLEENSQNEKAVALMREINEFLIQSFVDKVKAEPDNLKHRIELGWCLFQCERGDDVLQLLDTFSPDDSVAYDYVNLKSRCLFNMKRYGESLPLLLQWKEKIETIIAENADKSDDEVSDEIRKRRVRLGFCLYLVGICHKEIEKYDEAEQYLKQSMEAEKDKNEAYYYQEALGLVYMDKENYEMAVDIWDKMLNVNEEYLPAYVHRQKCYFELRNGQGVVDDYYRILSIYPQYSPAYVLAAKVFNIYSQFESTMEVIKQAKENQIESNALSLEEALCLKKMGKYEEAVALFKEIEKKVYNDENDIEDVDDFFMEEAIAFMANDNLPMAKQIIDEVIKKSSENRRAHWIRIDIVERMGDNAHEYYNEMKTKFMQDAEVNYEYGRYLMKCNRVKDAELEFHAAIKKNESHHGAYNQLMHIWQIRYRNVEEKDFYKTAVEMATKQLENDNDSYYYVERGLLYLDAYEFDKAIADFKMAIEKEEDNVYAMNGYGVSLMLQGKCEEAIEILKHGIEVMEENETHNLHYNLSKCYEMQGNFQAALECYHTMLEEFGDSLEWRGRMMDICNKMGDFKAAEELGDYRQLKYQEMLENGNDNARYSMIYNDIRRIEIAYLSDDVATIQAMTPRLKEAAKKMGLLKLIVTKGRNSEEENGRKSSVLFSLGLHFMYVQRDYQQAIIYFKAAVKYLPPIRDLGIDDKEMAGDIYKELAVAYMYHGNKANAMVNADRAVKAYLLDNQTKSTYPEYPRETPKRLGNLALIAFCMGDVKKAFAYTEQMSAHPLCAHCRHSECYEKYLCLGRFHQLLGNYAEACKMYEKAFELAPEDAECKVAVEMLRNKK